MSLLVTWKVPAAAMTAVRRFLAGFMRKIRTIDIGSAVLDPHYQCDRTGVVEADVGTCTFDEYFCFGFVHGESRDQDASARSGLDCVFFQPFGGAVGINSHYFTFEFGFEGLCRYIPPPAATTATTVSRNRNFLSICLSIEFYVDAKIAFSSVFQTDRSNYSICVYHWGGQKETLPSESDGSVG